LTITIDPTDAKDFDDAVSLRRTNDGEWELLVHIADVAHYVRPGSALDEEARRRSTSVYLPGRVLPMLPEQLSNNVCSLKPGVCRAVLTAAMVLGENRRPKRLRLQRSVIRSAARLNYDQVRDAVENEAADALDAERGPELLAALKEMRTLAGDMRRRRLEAGALDLDLPEIRPLLDERGKTVGWEKVEHHWAHQLIEEFMLAANGAVADQLVETDTTGLFRIHDEPDPAAMERFSEFLREFSLSFRRPYDRRELSRLLQKTRGAENGPMIHLALLTSLKQAVYAPVCRPHFALNASRYLHFTSPIRRYPDLIVHQSLHGRFTPAAAEAPRSAAGRLREAGDYEPLVGVTPDELQALAEHCSERERAAAEAEAQVVKLRQMDYMRRRQSDAWQGRIVRVLRTGFIVELEETGLSGFAAMRDLTDDYYEYIEPRHLLRGRRRGRCFRLGDKISVRILRLDSQRREVDLLPCSP
jgi:ribonuclease R